MLTIERDDGLLVHQAIVFAAKAHREQLRKGTDIPYIIHPFEVAQILTDAGAEAALIIAGLLHDVLEDTPVAAEAIGREFGQEVCRLVQSASEDKSQSWEARKERTVAFLREEASLDERLLACADKLSNLRSFQADQQALGEVVWTRFKRGRESQRWYYGALVEALAPLAGYAMYQELLERFQAVFGPAKKPDSL